MCKILLLTALPLFLASAASWAGQPISNSSALKAIFANPPREYSTAPLWVWNDDLTEEMVVSSLRDLAGQNVRQVFVHPRPGLMTPYLSQEWFRLWKIALAEAQRLDMNVWIYDENSYPSGFAGGLVPGEMPAARGRGLGMREEKQAPKWADDFIAVFRLDGGGPQAHPTRCEDVSDKVKAGESLPDGTYLVFTLLRAGDSPWFGGKCYVDLLYPGVTEKFIETTLEKYKREIGGQFGQRVPGTFTDEPHTVPAGGLPWTEHLPAEFQKRWGYSLLEHLPSLWRKVGDWKRVRHNYYQVVLEQFIEHWAKPMHDWCEKNNLEFTGHYWEHDWPRARIGPDNMAMYAFHQRPAIDILMNQYGEDVHAQFGNVRAVKELASVANQLGRRTLCEAYGAAGWDIRFEDLKRIGDWLYVLGVNTLDQHLSYLSIRGARKRDHPQSFSYHEPWWEAYHTQAQYFARLSVALSAGEEVNHVLVIEPTTTAWMYNEEGPDDAQLRKIGDEFQTLVTDLARKQVGFDIGCEDILARHGAVERSALRVGKARYAAVILPPSTENLNNATMAFLEKGLEVGLRVVCCGDPPARVDGQTSERGTAAAQQGGWERSDTQRVVGRFGLSGEVLVTPHAHRQGVLYHHLRQLADGKILFLANTSLAEAASGMILSNAAGYGRWNPWTGAVESYAFEPAWASSWAKTQAEYTLPPGGSLLLFLCNAANPPAPKITERSETLAPAGSAEIRRIAANVLTLDYVDVTAGGETRRDLYFYQAGQFVWQKNGLEGNPWDSAVQFKDELIRKTFPEGSGCEATYRFTVEGQVPADLMIVIERPDLYTITCNGQPVSARPGEWWLDQQFGKIDIANAARVGANEVILKASPMTMRHELEPAYVLGDFALKSTDKSFVITSPEPLKLGKWNEQGLPFYATGVTYIERFDVRPVSSRSTTSGAAPAATPPAGTETGRYMVSLPAWYGAVAKVVVNGELAGYIGAPPYECDVTALLSSGSNTIEVTVIGTLKNTLGPHHGEPPLGTAWPSMFQKAPHPGPPPGRKYATVGYGLFEPFVLKRLASPAP